MERPIVLDEETVGYVAIYGDLSQLYDRIGWYTAIVAIVLAVFAILFGIGVATYSPVLGFGIIVAVFIAAVVLLVYRLMRL